MNNVCVFCDRTKFEDRIVGEDGYFFIVATLRQISNGGYLLLIPKRHVSCAGAMGQREMSFLEAAQEKICNVLLEEYGVAPVIFEHGIVGQTIQHAHIHYVPETRDITGRILKDFSGSEITVVSSLGELRGLYEKRQKPYLFWRDQEGLFRVCWNPSAPPQYLRIVLAEAVGRPERSNWRSMNPELDKRLRQETVVRLKPYFLELLN